MFVSVSVQYKNVSFKKVLGVFISTVLGVYVLTIHIGFVLIVPRSSFFRQLGFVFQIRLTILNIKHLKTQLQRIYPISLLLRTTSTWTTNRHSQTTSTASSRLRQRLRQRAQITINLYSRTLELLRNYGKVIKKTREKNSRIKR